MKRFFIFLTAFLLFIYFSSCEKDDICVEGDTPLLIIGFYNFEDTTAFKAVGNFRLKAIDNDSIFNSSTEYGFSDRGTVSDSITIPLQILSNSTQLELISGSADENDAEIGNRDTLTFNYTVEEQFISKACGFVANFNELDTLRNVSTEDWIKRITIVKTNIQQSDSIHVKIFH